MFEGSFEEGSVKLAVSLAIVRDRQTLVHSPRCWQTKRLARVFYE